MISGTTPCFSSNPQLGFQIYEAMETFSSSSGTASGVESTSHALLCNLSVLKAKVEQARTLVNAVFSEDHIPQDSKAMAVTGMSTLTREIIGAASSLMLVFQQLEPLSTVPNTNGQPLQHHVKAFLEDSSQPSEQVMDHILSVEEGGTCILIGESHYFGSSSGLVVSVATGDEHNGYKDNMIVGSHRGLRSESEELQDFSSASCNVVELHAADLLAKYTHYCQACGKGFKREANLRMHMRAHGDEYKTTQALRNPMKDSSNPVDGRRYSCPQEGCRWNKRHPRFQPLKSLVCIKNHYRRSHCPKMYVCSRCNRKQFSVLSDLRTHEKHCGDPKWRCSCGTTFSRKDKLLGHLALFLGHAPATSCFEKPGESQNFC